MKKQALVSILVPLVLFAIPQAFAEVKPAGAVLDSECGLGNSFPRATGICLSAVQGSENQYLALWSENTELAPVGPSAHAPRPARSYLLVTSREQTGNLIVYTARGVVQPIYGDSDPMEQTYTLRVSVLPKGNVAQLETNGQVIFGADAIPLHYVAHTE